MPKVIKSSTTKKPFESPFYRKKHMELVLETKVVELKCKKGLKDVFNCKDASKVELKNNYNLSYRVRDKLNTYSDGGCTRGVCCAVYDNGKGPVVSLFKGRSTDAELIAAAESHLSLDNPEGNLVFHHTDCMSIIDNNYSGNTVAVDLLEQGENKEKVNYLKRMGHIEVEPDDPPEYLKHFSVIDNLARVNAWEFFNGVYKYVKLDSVMKLSGKLDISKCFIVCRCISTTGNINVVTIVKGATLRTIMFKGHCAPLDFPEVDLISTSGCKFRYITADRHEIVKFIQQIRDFTTTFLSNYLRGHPVVIDLSSSPQCQIELLN
jgi:hypothetical protein